jgi:invasion protein IalB
MKRSRALPYLLQGALLLSPLSAITVSVAQPAASVTRVEKTFGDWQVTCVDDGTKKECTLGTRAVAKGNAVAFIWTIKVVDKQLKSAFLVPPNISIPEGIRYSIGGANSETVSYSVCGARLCRADLPVDAGLIAKISAAQKATATYLTGAKKTIQVELNVTQFAPAYRYLYDQDVHK